MVGLTAMGRAAKRKKDAPSKGPSGTSPSPPRGAARRDSSERRDLTAWWIAAVLAVVTFLVYLPTLDADFIDFDDQAYVQDNRMVHRGLTADGFRWAFTTFEASNWHPLTWLSHMADVELFGLDAGAQHRTNVLLHIGSTLLLFFLGRRLMGGALGLWGAALVAALFALHPAHVESVAWVSERKDVLSTFLGLLALGQYLRYVERPGVGRYLGLVGLFALSLLAKPMLVTLPFVLLLLDFWPLRRFETISVPRCAVEKLPLLALSAASSYVTVLAQKAGGAVAPYEQLGLLERVANSTVAYAAYLGKLVWPTNLALYYPRLESPGALAVLLSAVLLLAFTFGCWRQRRARPYLAVGWLWYLGTLVPVVGLVQVGGQAMADRYTYVPWIGLYFIVALAATEWAGRSRERQQTVVGAAAVVLLVLAVLTYRQGQRWENSEAIFSHSIAVTEDNYLMHNNLGGVLIDQGRFAEARPHLEAAVRITPAYAEAQTNLGVVLAHEGDFPGAIARYREAIRLDPTRPMAYNNLASALAQAGQPEEALEPLGQSLALQPDQVEARNNLGNVLASLGRPEEALVEYQRALDLDPRYANGHANRANALRLLERREEARQSYERALELNPAHLEARVNLAALLLEEGDPVGATTQLNQALAQNPNIPQAHYLLALALAQSGDREGVVREFHILERLAPPLAQQLQQILTGE